MPHFLARWLLPLSIAASLASYVYADANGADLHLAVLLPGLGVLLAGMIGERYLPYRSAWNGVGQDTRTDVWSAATLFAVVDPVLQMLVPLAATASLSAVPALAALAVFPVHWPFVAQVLLALLLAELGSYCSHRLHHALPSLWWLHALHHGSERLYALNNFRIHPLNYALNHMAGIFPLLLIGTPEHVILACMALCYPVLMLQHANLRLQSGWLNRVFSTNEVHRWHHSAAPGEGDCNFGRTLVLWDQVFGSFRYLPARNDPAAIGLYPGHAYPHRASFVDQLRSMFHPTCCRAAA